jgi:hypothetical protein
MLVLLLLNHVRTLCWIHAAISWHQQLRLLLLLLWLLLRRQVNYTWLLFYNW